MKVCRSHKHEKGIRRCPNRGDGTRTHDHVFIGDALYPLSYTTDILQELLQIVKEEDKENYGY